MPERFMMNYSISELLCGTVVQHRAVQIACELLWEQKNKMADFLTHYARLESGKFIFLLSLKINFI